MNRIEQRERVNCRFALVAILAALAVAGCPFGRKKETPPRRLISGPVAFKYSTIDDTPNAGKDGFTDVLAFGDINGDGFSDVIIGSQGAKADGLVWYEFPLWTKHPVGSGEFTTDGKTADIDRDGRLDIVIGDMNTGLVWFRNPGGDSSGPWARHLVGPGYVHDIEAADMDGDGDLDIVTCDKNAVVLWRQEAPDRWTRIILFEKKGEGIALADIDRDGDLDVVFGGTWLEAPRDRTQNWTAHVFAPDWPADTRVVVVDMNGDGRRDVVLTASEGKGRVSWFEAPQDPRQTAWQEHAVTTDTLEGAHSLQVADMDLDGDLDIVVAEMHTSPEKRAILYLQTQDQWTPFVISRRGSHNLHVADVDGDGDADIVGKNYAGQPRPIEYWENLSANRSTGGLLVDLPKQPRTWRYISIDSARPASDKGKMGLVFADVNADGFQDVVAGSCVYLNPYGALENPWERMRLPETADVYFALPIDDDAEPDLVGIAGNDVLWLEAKDKTGRQWEATTIASVPEGRTQGYAAAQLEPGGKPQLIFTRGQRLFCLRIPDHPTEKSPWDLITLSEAVEEEGIAIGDIDGDGDLDIAAVARDGHHTLWLENPGTLRGQWKTHVIGTSTVWSDRVALADVNGDGALDLVSTEEDLDGYYKSHLYWFEAPRDRTAGAWIRHPILTLRSINSMDTADLDGDGRPDIVVAEHTDLRNGEWEPDNVTAVLYNRDRGGRWEVQKVEVDGHSSHLGGKAIDLNNDGHPEIVSIAWEQYWCVHLWTPP